MIENMKSNKELSNKLQDIVAEISNVRKDMKIDTNIKYTYLYLELMRSEEIIEDVQRQLFQKE